MLRGGATMIDEAVALLAAGWAVTEGAPVATAVPAALLILATWGASWSLLASGSPLRLLLGYRLVGRDGGPAPVAGVLLRELGRPLVALPLVLSGGAVGAMVSARTERRMRQVTRTHIVGTPRSEATTAVALWGTLVALVALGRAVSGWGGAIGDDALGVLAVVGAAFGAGIVALARVEIDHLDRIGELEDADVALVQEYALPIVVDRRPPTPQAEVGWPTEGPGTS